MQIWKENGLKIFIKNPQEIKLMRESGAILGKILYEVEQMIKPGITTLEINQRVEELIKQFGVKSSFKGYGGFPANVCATINDEVVHGIPSKRKLKEGDIITIDSGVIYKGFHSDSAIQVGVGKISAEAEKFLKTAQKALDKAIETARPGIRVGKISAIIEDTIKKEGYSAVKDLTGHGIGKNLHEDPPVPNFKDRDMGPILQEGMTIAIEPIINMGSDQVVLSKDKWTYTTKDGSLSTQVEHTIAITRKGHEILTKRP